MTAVRASPGITAMRAQLPYVDYERYTHIPNEENAGPVRNGAAMPVSPQWKTLMPTYGSQHINDVADFSLWCEETTESKHLRREQQLWVLCHYHAKEVGFEYPLIIVITDTPPGPLTLTIAGIAALFVPDAPLCTGFNVNTAYASPRVPDPSPVLVKRWMAPTRRETDLILKSLAGLCNVKAINWFGLYCFIELHTNDGRSYKRHSLPGRVAGKTTTYHHSADRFWDEPQNLELIRRVDPRLSAVISPLQDRTDYLREGPGVLRPGVRIAAGHPDSSATPSMPELGTSCGVRLRHSTGRLAVTIASQAQDCQDIYHPDTTNGSKIGTVVERWPRLSIAMVDLASSLRFSKSGYFQAASPKWLVRSDNVPNGTWCSCDGMSTGLVFLHCQGLRISNIHGKGGYPGECSYLAEKLYSTFRPVGGRLSEGIMGAPIVKEMSRTADSGGDVCGMFCSGDESVAIASVLDDIIDAGWKLY
ncbi:hypothetical protein TRV_00168 [Trichophyton verrucosum HKI 0517]|uniref:Uncharacterized protein n=1 Tax=Trichophyton verrucosum (strain HKI 0517) TaxID=663202 RepID=D4CZC6_TRIVH|nr:uncharacterized protein TRV_00168 [Trichophyton verrucosum HKI 0517]EFE45034.1 hypothetical protein TRV_00168 [Trichophyton verrucosum HKI 0517]